MLKQSHLTKEFLLKSIKKTKTFKHGVVTIRKEEQNENDNVVKLCFDYGGEMLLVGVIQFTQLHNECEAILKFEILFPVSKQTYTVINEMNQYLSVGKCTLLENDEGEIVLKISIPLIFVFDKNTITQRIEYGLLGLCFIIANIYNKYLDYIVNPDNAFDKAVMNRLYQF